MPPRKYRPDLKVIPGKGRRDIYYKQAAIYYIILSLFVVLLLQTGYQWLGNAVLARRLQVITVERGFMEDSCSLEGIISRNEEVIYSPCSGLLLELAPAGERVAVGGDLASLFKVPLSELTAYRREEDETPASFWDKVTNFFGGQEGYGEEESEEEQAPSPIYIIPSRFESWPERIVELTAETAGLFSPEIDGWEGLTKPYLDRQTYEGRSRPKKIAAVGSYVEEGQPIFKIADNWLWYFSLILPYERGEELAGLEKVKLSFSFAPEETGEAFLEEVQTDLGPGVIGLTYRLERQITGFEKNRWAEASVVYRRYEGILVPRQALCEEPETGLLVDEKGFAAFHPVEVIKIQGDQALVEGIPPYSDVITRPELIREGYRLN